MTTLIETKNKVIELGGNEWNKNGMERVYITCDILNKLSSEGASYGERNNKIFLDVKTGKIMRSYKGKKPTLEFDLLNK